MIQSQQAHHTIAKGIGYTPLAMDEKNLLATGATTVGHLSDHIQSLKNNALALSQQINASKRGYFTPSEDEALRQLLFSYWTTRAAMLEQIQIFQPLVWNDGRGGHASPNTGDTNTICLQAFVIAYAGAAVLMDAGKSMYRWFRHRPTVICKLNEPEPALGLPGGIYDTVQQSLTSPLTTWQLYQAGKHYKKQRRRIKQLAKQDAAMLAMVQIIKRHRRVLKRGWLAYLRARASVRKTQMRSWVTRSALGNLLFAMEMLAGCAASEIQTKPGHVPALPKQVQTQLTNLLELGDILITRKEHALTNYFLPGHWPHGLIYLGTADQLKKRNLHDDRHLKLRWQHLVACDPTNPHRVYEAKRDGVLIRPLAEALACDAVVVLRPMLSQDDICQAIARGLSHVDKPYDFDFDFTRSDKLVCTELIYRCYDGIAGIGFTLTKRSGRMTLSAEDILAMAVNHQHFTPIAMYALPWTQELVTGPQVADVLRQTCALP